MSDKISLELLEHIEVFNNLSNIKDEIDKIAMLCVKTLKNKNKILICGNGGSAADAQHFATEITTKFSRIRSALPAISLSTDTSALTAIGNDFGFEKIFSRQVEALGKKGDLLVSISTSGNSSNILEAITKAKNLKLNTLSLLGKDGGKAAKISDNSIIIPSNSTARVQEAHIFIIHYICKIIDEEF